MIFINFYYYYYLYICSVCDVMVKKKINCIYFKFFVKTNRLIIIIFCFVTIFEKCQYYLINNVF